MRYSINLAFDIDHTIVRNGNIYRESAEALVKYLDVDNGIIIDAGVGTGEGMRAVLKQNPKVRVVGVEREPGTILATKYKFGVISYQELREKVSQMEIRGLEEGGRHVYEYWKRFRQEVAQYSRRVDFELSDMANPKLLNGDNVEAVIGNYFINNIDEETLPSVFNNVNRLLPIGGDFIWTEQDMAAGISGEVKRRLAEKFLPSKEVEDILIPWEQGRLRFLSNLIMPSGFETTFVGESTENHLVTPHLFRRLGSQAEDLMKSTYLTRREKNETIEEVFAEMELVKNVELRKKIGRYVTERTVIARSRKVRDL